MVTRVTDVQARWLTSVETVQAVDDVTGALHAAITAGELAPGRELSARSVGDRQGVTLDVAEAALARLESSGALARRGRSLIVPPLDRHELRRLYQVRRLLEPDLAADTSRHCTPQLLAALRSGCAEVLDAALTEQQRAAAARRVRMLRVSPIQSRWERRALHLAWLPLERYTRLGLRITAQPVMVDQVGSVIDGTLDAYRRRSPGDARTRHLRLIDQVESVDQTVLHYFDASPRTFPITG